MCFLRTAVQPILVFGVEAQQVTERELKKLDSIYVDMASRVISRRRLPGQVWLDWRIEALREAKLVLTSNNGSYRRFGWGWRCVGGAGCVGVYG